MVEFPYRIDTQTRRSTRELEDRRDTVSVPEEIPPVVMSVYGQGSTTNDPTLSGENLDHVIAQFISRLKTPGNQISGAALQRLVLTVTEMVDGLAAAPSPRSQPSLSQTQTWVSSYGQPQESGYTPLIPVNPMRAWGGDELYTQNDVPILALTHDELGAFPSFGAEDTFSNYAMTDGNIYYTNPQHDYSFSQGEVTGNEESLVSGAPEEKIQIKALFVPKGMPLSLLREEDGEEVEPAPTLYDFIQGIEHTALPETIAGF